MPIMKQLVPNRIVIYPKDVQNITGKKERSARKLISDIRLKLGKSKEEFVSINDFCNYTGLKKEQVEAFLVY